VAAESAAAFDAAAASSTYAGAGFSAGEATSKGTGYWCSAGNHAPGQSVTWTGTLAARQKALGVTFNWAYGPGEYKVLTSADGGNFQEATCWRSAKRNEVSYKETLMFEGARNVEALTVVMRSPRPWGYFGLNDVALIVEPGPMMLISGSSAKAGERCVVALPNAVVGMEDCLQAITAGAGHEIFQWNEESQIVSTRAGKCLSFAGGSQSGGGGLVALQDCAQASEAGDGRSNFELTAAGQLRFKYMGNYCLVTSQAGVHVQDCSTAEESGAAQDKFFLAAVPEFDPARAAAAVDVGTLLQAAAARQGGLVAELHDAIPKLEACKLALSANASHVQQPLTLGQTRNHVGSMGKDEAAAKAIGGMYSSLGVDMAGIKKLISETSAALALARSKAASTV